jgi:Mn2+/Fe2+ NRAMP family transporter
MSEEVTTEVFELPPPPKTLTEHIRAIGPGVILASLSIGAGEWYLFPAAILAYGPNIMWTAVIGCIVQAVLGSQSIKYTLYSGQPIHHAYLRLGKPIVWAWVWALLIFIPVIWPGWAAASATAIVALQLGRLPGPADSNLVLMWGVVLLVISLLILHVGGKVQKTLELINWPIVVMIVVLVAVGVVLGAPAWAWADIVKGIFTPYMPLGRNADWFVMSAAIAYIPAGFGFNLMLSSYARDKGWGMAYRVGYISTLVGGRKVRIETEAVPFNMRGGEALKRWRGWVNVARIDSWIVMSFITFLTVLMTSVLTYGLLAPRGLKLGGWAVASAQALALSEVLGPIAWFIVLFAGFWMLLGTQFGLMDSTSRVITDCFWLASPRIRAWAKEDPRRIYYPVLYLEFTIALILLIASIGFGLASPYWLTALGANLGLFALLLAYILQIVVDYKIMPKELRPHPITTFIVIVGMLWYGFFLTALLLQTLTGVRL